MSTARELIGMALDLAPKFQGNTLTQLLNQALAQLAVEEQEKERLEKLAMAYQNALENDYCNFGEYQGCRPDEIARRLAEQALTLSKGGENVEPS